MLGILKLANEGNVSFLMGFEVVLPTKGAGSYFGGYRNMQLFPPLPQEGFPRPNYCCGETEEDCSVGDSHDPRSFLGSEGRRGGGQFSLLAHLLCALVNPLISTTSVSDEGGLTGYLLWH